MSQNCNKRPANLNLPRIFEAKTSYKEKTSPSPLCPNQNILVDIGSTKRTSNFSTNEGYSFLEHLPGREQYKNQNQAWTPVISSNIPRSRMHSDVYEETTQPYFEGSECGADRELRNCTAVKNLLRNFPVRVFLLLALLALTGTVGTILAVSAVDLENEAVRDIQLTINREFQVKESNQEIHADSDYVRKPQQIGNNVNLKHMAIIATTVAVPPPLVDDKDSIINIQSEVDLIQLDTNHNFNSILVEKLVDKYDNWDSTEAANDFPPKFEIKAPENIKHLNISGPITERWLVYLLEKLENIDHLTLNIDQLCVGATVRDRSTLPSLELKHLTTLKLENSHFCSITSWALRWSFPKIRDLLIINADLTSRTFKPIHEFLERGKSTLNSVEISNCYICPDCAFSNVEYESIKSIRILHQLDNPLMYERLAAVQAQNCA